MLDVFNILNFFFLYNKHLEVGYQVINIILDNQTHPNEVMIIYENNYDFT